MYTCSGSYDPGIRCGRAYCVKEKKIKSSRFGVALNPKHNTQHPKGSGFGPWLSRGLGAHRVWKLRGQRLREYRN